MARFSAPAPSLPAKTAIAPTRRRPTRMTNIRRSMRGLYTRHARAEYGKARWTARRSEARQAWDDKEAKNEDRHAHRHGGARYCRDVSLRHRRLRSTPPVDAGAVDQVHEKESVRPFSGRQAEGPR